MPVTATPPTSRSRSPTGAAASPRMYADVRRIARRRPRGRARRLGAAARRAARRRTRRRRSTPSRRRRSRASTSRTTTRRTGSSARSLPASAAAARRRRPATDGVVPFERIGTVELGDLGTLAVWVLRALRRAGCSSRCKDALAGTRRHVRRRAVPARHHQGRGPRHGRRPARRRPQLRVQPVVRLRPGVDLPAGHAREHARASRSRWASAILRSVSAADVDVGVGQPGAAVRRRPRPRLRARRAAPRSSRSARTARSQRVFLSAPWAADEGPVGDWFGAATTALQTAGVAGRPAGRRPRLARAAVARGAPGRWRRCAPARATASSSTSSRGRRPAGRPTGTALLRAVARRSSTRVLAALPAGVALGRRHARGGSRTSRGSGGTAARRGPRAGRPGRGRRVQRPRAADPTGSSRSPARRSSRRRRRACRSRSASRRTPPRSRAGRSTRSSTRARRSSRRRPRWSRTRSARCPATRASRSSTTARGGAAGPGLTTAWATRTVRRASAAGRRSARCRVRPGRSGTSRACGWPSPRRPPGCR